MKYYLEDTEKIFSQLKSSPQGLSRQEAEKRLAEHGPNKLAEAKKPSLLSRFVKQLMDPMIIILLAFLPDALAKDKKPANEASEASSDTPTESLPEETDVSIK